MDVIRAQVQDLPEAAPLFAAYREFYGAEHDVDAGTAFLVKRVARQESIVLLVRNGASAVGFAQIYPTFSSTRLAALWILNDLFVEPDARGTGAVDALIDTAAALAKEAGAVALELETGHTNLRAQAVYARHGFLPDEANLHYEKPIA